MSLSLSQLSVATVDPSQMSQLPSPEPDDPFSDKEDDDNGAPEEIHATVTAEDDNDDDNGDLPASQMADISGSQVFEELDAGPSQSQEGEHPPGNDVAVETVVENDEAHSPPTTNRPQTFEEEKQYKHFPSDEEHPKPKNI